MKTRFINLHSTLIPVCVPVDLHGPEEVPTTTHQLSCVQCRQDCCRSRPSPRGRRPPSAPSPLTSPSSGAWALHSGAHTLFPMCPCGVALFPEATAPLPPLSGYKDQLVSTSTTQPRSSLKGTHSLASLNLLCPSIALSIY